jgi:hypothetical protein
MRLFQFPKWQPFDASASQTPQPPTPKKPLVEPSESGSNKIEKNAHNKAGASAHQAQQDRRARSALTHSGQLGTVPSSTPHQNITEPVQPPRGVAFLRSGGVRENENGTTVSFYVRQNPTNFTQADWGIGSVPNEGPIAWRPKRSEVPDAIKHPIKGLVREQRQPPLRAARKEMDRAVHIPSFLARSAQLLREKSKGKVAHGWIYEQHPDPIEPNAVKMYALNARRQYVSAHPKEVVGTDQTRQARQIELYELDTRHAPAAQPPPAQVQAIDVLLPQTHHKCSIHDAGEVRRIATVTCYELGRNYLLYRPEISVEQATENNKRTLLINAHGADPDGVPLQVPVGMKISYFGPRGFSIKRPTGLPYATLKNPHKTYGAGESSSPENSLLTKFGSPVHDAIGSQSGHVIHNQAEGAAWAAHDRGLDVLNLRHTLRNQMLKGTLEDVLSEINKAGLSEHYDHVLVLACRAKWGQNRDESYSIIDTP